MSHKIYLLDDKFNIVGETDYLKANHLDKTKFKWFKIDNSVFPNTEVIKVFKQIDLNTGKERDIFFEIKGIKWLL
jgi:hypothetical protein